MRMTGILGTILDRFKPSDNIMRRNFCVLRMALSMKQACTLYHDSLGLSVEEREAARARGTLDQGAVGRFAHMQSRYCVEAFGEKGRKVLGQVLDDQYRYRKIFGQRLENRGQCIGTTG